MVLRPSRLIEVSRLEKDPEKIKALYPLCLAVRAANDPSITARISALADEGIPCVTFNSDLPDSRRPCSVGQDIYNDGALTVTVKFQIAHRGQ